MNRLSVCRKIARKGKGKGGERACRQAFEAAIPPTFNYPGDHRPRADLWPFYGFLCKPLLREKTVNIKTHKTAINRPVDHTGET